MKMLLCVTWEIIFNQCLCSAFFFSKDISLTTYFWEILHSAPAFEIGPSSELNKGELRELQDEDEELDKKRRGVQLTQQEVFDRDPHGR